MTAIEITNGRPESGGYKVDVLRGGHNGRVSSEWFSRPDDEKFLSLSDLYASVKGRTALALHTAWHKRLEPLPLIVPENFAFHTSLQKLVLNQNKRANGIPKILNCHNNLRSVRFRVLGLARVGFRPRQGERVAVVSPTIRPFQRGQGRHPPRPEGIWRTIVHLGVAGP